MISFFLLYSAHILEHKGGFWICFFRMFLWIENGVSLVFFSLAVHGVGFGNKKGGVGSLFRTLLQ